MRAANGVLVFNYQAFAFELHILKVVVGTIDLGWPG